MPGLAEGGSCPQKAKNRKHQNPSWTKVHGSTTSATHGIYWGCTFKTLQWDTQKDINSQHPVMCSQRQPCGCLENNTKCNAVRSEPSRLTSTSETIRNNLTIFWICWLTAHGPKCPAKICSRRQAFEG